MIRACFLCGDTVDPIFATTWALPGLAPAEIGFSVCSSCGSVCQSPGVPFADMMAYYSTMAVYTNPGRQALPTEAKVRDLDEQIQFIKRGIGHLPPSILQIGCSDGYSLSRFRAAGIPRVVGVEPGTASVALARQLYDIDCIHGTAEDFVTTETFGLILLTHVLEHLYEPQAVLAHCRQLHPPGTEGFIYVEVPLMAQPDSLCPGFFSFEHINYYTRENLLESLLRVGYAPVSVVEHFNSNLSPAIGVLASTRAQNHYRVQRVAPAQNRQIVADYRRKELDYWQACLNRLLPHLQGNIYLWGAGIHTSQLVANTDLLSRCTVAGLTDTSPLKWAIRQGDWVCQAPDSIAWQAGDTVIISSYASEKEIYDALAWLRDKGVQTLRLHNVDDTRAH